MTTTLNKPNQYAARCIRCGGWVPAKEGLIARTDAGGWAADHIGECPTTVPMAVAEPVKRVDTHGIYRDTVGTIWKVQHARQGSGRLYAKRLHLTTCAKGRDCGHPTVLDEDGEHRHGHFIYEPGAIHKLTDDMRMPLEEAAAFGRLYGICARCGADLTDEDSIARGLGPICAGRF